MSEQAARCVLKLNTPVLNALFPEGSEARVELVNAALTEVTNTYFKTALSQHVKNHLFELAQEVQRATNVAAVVKQYFDDSGAWNSVISVKPGSKLADAIARSVESALSAKLIKMIDDEVERRVTLFSANLESRVENAVNQRVERLTTDAIQKRVDAAVNAARAAL